MTPSPSSPSFEPLFLALCAVAGWAYWRAVRASPEPVPRWRIGCFAAGLLLVAGALNSPLETIAAHYLLLVHLLQNVMLADWAPPLLVIGLTPAMRAAIAVRGGRPLAALTQLRVALPVWLVAWYVIHFASVYDFALERDWALNLEHLVLLAIGFVFWWPVLTDSPHAAPTLLRTAFVLAGFLGSAFLGLALTFSGDAFYGFYEDAPRLWGLSPTQDQNYGGVLMTTEQALVFLAAIGWLLARMFREDEERERALREGEHLDGGADREPGLGAPGERVHATAEADDAEAVSRRRQLGQR